MRADLDDDISREEIVVNDKDYMDILWKYFELHSNQRMQLMNFFIVLESLMVAGLVSLLSSKNNLWLWECGICIGILFFAVIFYGLDRRTKQLIKLCEDSIKKLEQKSGGTDGSVTDWAGIFSKEECITRTKKEKWTYSRLFRIQYCFFAVIAIIMLLFIVCLSK